MFGIIRKNALHYGMIPVAFLVVVTYNLIHWGHTFGLIDALVSGFLAYFACLLPVAMVEGKEEKQKGYQFMSLLPVPITEIVMAKYLVVLLTIVIVTGYFMGLTRFVGMAPTAAAMTRAVVMSNAILCVALAGIVYVLVYRFGMVAFMVMGGVAIFGLNVITLLLGRTVRRNKAAIGRAEEWLAGMPWYVLLAAALAALVLFYISMQHAIRIKKEKLVS